MGLALLTWAALELSPVLGLVALGLAMVILSCTSLLMRRLRVSADRVVATVNRRVGMEPTVETTATTATPHHLRSLHG